MMLRTCRNQTHHGICFFPTSYAHPCRQVHQWIPVPSSRRPRKRCLPLATPLEPRIPAWLYRKRRPTRFLLQLEHLSRQISFLFPPTTAFIESFGTFVGIQRP